MPGVTKSKRSLLAIVGARDILIQQCHFDNSAFGHLIHIHDRAENTTLPHTDNITIVDPGAEEQVANGADNDCDGYENCFTDADGDGYGSHLLLERCAHTHRVGERESQSIDIPPRAVYYVVFCISLIYTGSFKTVRIIQCPLS